MPYRKMSHRKTRLEVCRLTFDLMRTCHDTVFGYDTQPSPDNVYVIACVGIGHAENRPMTATKIALYSRLPRTTVLRKLDELIAAGWVARTGTLYYLSPDRLDETTYALFRCKRMIVSACDALTRIDQNGHPESVNRPDRTL